MNMNINISDLYKKRSSTNTLNFIHIFGKAFYIQYIKIYIFASATSFQWELSLIHVSLHLEPFRALCVITSGR